MQELIQKWAARDDLYATALYPLTEGEADSIRSYRRKEAGELAAFRERKTAYMAASRWVPPELGAW